MFTSQRLKAVPAPGSVEVREQRLDEVVHQLDVRGSLSPENVGTVARRIDAALQAGVRWLIVDLAGADAVSDPMLHALVATARECRTRRGEVIVTGATPEVTARLTAFDQAERPAMAATVDQAIIILKMLRPKTQLGAGRARQRVTSLSLPRIEPRPLS
jgi:anti-anti-sigma regulatory factor